MNGIDFETAREAQGYLDYSQRTFDELGQLLEAYKKCDDTRVEKLKFAILNKVAEYAQYSTSLKVKKIREALEDPGKKPNRHLKTLKICKEGWPTLFDAIDDAVYGKNYAQMRELEREAGIKL